MTIRSVYMSIVCPTPTSKLTPPTQPNNPTLQQSKHHPAIMRLILLLSLTVQRNNARIKDASSLQTNQRPTTSSEHQKPTSTPNSTRPTKKIYRPPRHKGQKLQQQQQLPQNYNEPPPSTSPPHDTELDTTTSTNIHLTTQPTAPENNNPTIMETQEINTNTHQQINAETTTTPLQPITEDDETTPPLVIDETTTPTFDPLDGQLVQVLNSLNATLPSINFVIQHFAPTHIDYPILTEIVEAIEDIKQQMNPETGKRNPQAIICRAEKIHQLVLLAVNLTYNKNNPRPKPTTNIPIEMLNDLKLAYIYSFTIQHHLKQHITEEVKQQIITSQLWKSSIFNKHYAKGLTYSLLKEDPTIILEPTAYNIEKDAVLRYHEQIVLPIIKQLDQYKPKEIFHIPKHPELFPKWAANYVNSLPLIKGGHVVTKEAFKSLMDHIYNLRHNKHKDRKTIKRTHNINPTPYERPNQFDRPPPPKQIMPNKPTPFQITPIDITIPPTQLTPQPILDINPSKTGHQLTLDEHNFLKSRKYDLHFTPTQIQEIGKLAKQDVELWKEYYKTGKLFHPTRPDDDILLPMRLEQIQIFAEGVRLLTQYILNPPYKPENIGTPFGTLELLTPEERRIASETYKVQQPPCDVYELKVPITQGRELPNSITTIGGLVLNRLYFPHYHAPTRILYIKLGQQFISTNPHPDTTNYPNTEFSREQLHEMPRIIGKYKAPPQLLDTRGEIYMRLDLKPHTDKVYYKKLPGQSLPQPHDMPPPNFLPYSASSKIPRLTLRPTQTIPSLAIAQGGPTPQTTSVGPMTSKPSTTSVGPMTSTPQTTAVGPLTYNPNPENGSNHTIYHPMLPIPEPNKKLTKTIYTLEPQKTGNYNVPPKHTDWAEIKKAYQNPQGNNICTRQGVYNIKPAMIADHPHTITYKPVHPSAITMTQLTKNIITVTEILNNIIETLKVCYDT